MLLDLTRLRETMRRISHVYKTASALIEHGAKNAPIQQTRDVLKLLETELRGIDGEYRVLVVGSTQTTHLQCIEDTITAFYDTMQRLSELLKDGLEQGKGDAYGCKDVDYLCRKLCRLPLRILNACKDNEYYLEKDIRTILFDKSQSGGGEGEKDCANVLGQGLSVDNVTEAANNAGQDGTFPADTMSFTHRAPTEGSQGPEEGATGRAWTDTYRHGGMTFHSVSNRMTITNTGSEKVYVADHMNIFHR